MAFRKEPRAKASLLGRLRKMLDPSPKPRHSRVAQPGARPEKVEAQSRSRPDEGFGKRRTRRD
jgi:hypothetical protein